MHYKKDTVLKESVYHSELEKCYMIYRNALHGDSHPMMNSIVPFNRKALLFS